MPAPAALADRAAITALIDASYLGGLRAGSWATASRAFHPDAIMYGHVGESSLTGPAAPNLAAYIANHGPAPRLTAVVDVLDATDSTAVARVQMEHDAAGASFVDLLTLWKGPDGWQIIAKAFATYAP
ncbi:hypothetical protein Q8F55_008068 [Vanrija albida]|uniref:SnoaL-like domain-containing protein n=1 Tax=Vanrija albida TaxID=181172 RepID=A0ABR3PVC3_9TREE